MKFLLPSLFIFFLSVVQAHAANPGDIVINEIAWMGTESSYHQEWLELYNNTDSALNIEGWILRATDGTPSIILEGTVTARGFFLLEKSSSAIPLVPAADQTYTGSLMVSSGEHLELTDGAGNIIDDINAFGSWFAGDNTTKQTMERKNPILTGSDPVNWSTSVGGGTPKAQNSTYIVQNSPISDPPPSPSLPSPPAPPSEPAPPPVQSPSPTEQNPSPEPTATSTPQSSQKLAAGQAESATSTPVKPPNPTYPTNIFINELMPSPLGPDELEEWIEIINESDETADISQWQIKDTLGAINAYVLSATIPSKSFIVLSRPITQITMNNDNDAIQLIRPDGELIQTVPYKKAPKGKSYVRSKGVWKWSSVPTPGSANIVPAPPRQTGTIEDVKEVIRKTTTDNNDSAVATTTVNAAATPSSSSSLTAAIGNAAPQNQNTFIYILASLIALISAAFVLLLKKLLSRY